VPPDTSPLDQDTLQNALRDANLETLLMGHTHLSHDEARAFLIRHNS
jgi:hypothetical protein